MILLLYAVAWNAAGAQGSGKDTDNDGLSDREERRLGTDKKNPDTDGDGLSDGAEVHSYRTNPLAADSDGDSLLDGKEVHVHRTNPLAMDTDGDGLSDRSEVEEYGTSALKADTDGDGLDDGVELLKYRTDPLAADSDGDTLPDGDELLQHMTDPLKTDSDGGGVDDDAEILRGSSPRNPADDVPKVSVEIGKPIVLEGIRFASGSARILPVSQKVLSDVLETLRDNSHIVVEIHGHTDNVGSADANHRLSLARAEAVRNWLIGKGIEPERLTARGFGAEKPLVRNNTPVNRARNRRIEFVRVR